VRIKGALLPGAVPAAAYYAYGQTVRYAEWSEAGQSWIVDVVADLSLPLYIEQSVSFDVDPEGNPCLTYVGDDYNPLKLARRTGPSVWTVEDTTALVDNLSNVPYHSLVVDGNGLPHIAFFFTLEGVVKESFKDEQGVWRTLAIDDHSARGELCVAGDGSLHAVTWTPRDRGFFHFVKDEWGGLWKPLNPIDWPNGAYDVSFHSNPATSLPAVAYTELSPSEEGTLKYAEWDPSGDEWTAEVVCEAGEMGSVDLQFNPQGGPVISFTDYGASPARTRLARRNGGEWESFYPPLHNEWPGFQAFLRTGYAKNLVIYNSNEGRIGTVRAWRGYFPQPDPILESLGSMP
jgi:hypothetical protein